MSHLGEPCKETVSLGGGGGVQNLPATAANISDELTIKEFIPASWFHPVGIFKVLARFWDRLPDVSGKLFLTFTLDPKNYANEETAFEDSRDWLRKLFYQLRQGVEHEGKTYVIDAPYCIKVEFHESGWVHFHAIFLTRRFLPKELLAELWDRGGVTVQRITTPDFHYLLKYVTKAADLPEWVRKRKRLRVFQTTKGFLKPLPPKPKTISLKEPRKRASYTMAIIVIACQRTSFANAASTVTGSSAGAPPAGEENSLLISQKNCAIQQPTQGKCRKASAAFSST